MRSSHCQISHAADTYGCCTQIASSILGRAAICHIQVDKLRGSGLISGHANAIRQHTEVICRVGLGIRQHEIPGGRAVLCGNNRPLGDIDGIGNSVTIEV